jgi:hypothetical protein
MQEGHRSLAPLPAERLPGLVDYCALPKMGLTIILPQMGYLPSSHYTRLEAASGG